MIVHKSDYIKLKEKVTTSWYCKYEKFSKLGNGVACFLHKILVLVYWNTIIFIFPA